MRDLLRTSPMTTHLPFLMDSSTSFLTKGSFAAARQKSKVDPYQHQMHERVYGPLSG
jgi:hypothetical protein